MPIDCTSHTLNEISTQPDGDFQSTDSYQWMPLLKTLICIAHLKNHFDSTKITINSTIQCIRCKLSNQDHQTATLSLWACDISVKQIKHCQYTVKDIKSDRLLLFETVLSRQLINR